MRPALLIIFFLAPSFTSGGMGALSAQPAPVLYAPAIASPNSIILGTAGPNGSVAVEFRDNANRSTHKTARVNGDGRFMLRAPANAVGIDFSVAGLSAHCIVSANRKLIAGGLAARHAASGALAVVAAQAAYDIAQPLRLQVEGFNPLSGRAIIDGAPTLLLAASDRSIAAAIGAKIPLGRHAFGVLANGHAVSIQADLVKTSLSVTGTSSDYHIPRDVTLKIDGLYGDRASVTFDVGNGAVLANNKEEETVPVTPTGDGGGQSSTTVRANHPGEVDLKWKLNVGLDYKIHYDLGNYETPRPYTPPTPEPTPLVPCTIRLTDGWFESVQGPFQDDPVFTEKPERLLREAGDKISYYGQLDMVKDRPSALMGVLEYSKDGTLVKVDSRNTIVMKGETNCSEYAAVKIRFTLHEHGQGPHVIYTSPIAGWIFFKGGAGPKFTPWQAQVPTFSGVPEAPFTFNVAGDFYAIEAELVDEHDHSLGMSMWLNGHVSETYGPQLRLLPLLLSHSVSDAQTQERTQTLVDDANRLSGELFEHIPDVYPLKPHGLPVPQVGEPIDLTGTVFDTSWDDAISFDTTIRRRYEQNLKAALDDRFATTTVLQGVSRTIAILVNSDFDQLVGPGAVGYTMSTKLVAVKRGQPWTTSGHEVAHTMPQFLWSSTEMQSQCNLDYHNKYDGVAYGLQTMKLSRPIAGEQHYGYPFDLMQGAGEDAWVTQCTYDNLLTALKGPTDPRIFMVRFYLAQPVHHGVVGKLRPAYITQATLSPQAKNGSFAVNTYNAAGGLIEHHTFEPQFLDENNFMRNIISVQVRMRYDPAIARVDLRGPKNALLDSMTVSRVAPAVKITTARLAGRQVTASWTGSGERGRQLLFSGFLSRDGRVYEEAFFERTMTHVTLMLRKTFHPRFLRIVVSDGSKSAENVRRLSP